ncbi:MAG: septum formation initiator family protein [Bacteroidaceae bacterium]|nr:septum formation initiator family protein [Bacteroidaceae bacterium]
MGRLQRIAHRIGHSSVTKYVVTLFFIILIVGFLDDNSFWNRRERKATIEKLQEEIAELKTVYEEDTRKLEALEKYDNVVRLAREMYFMKRPNEDVYIINCDKKSE